MQALTFDPILLYGFQELLSLDFNSAILLISAYSNPVETIQHAQEKGYRVADFMVTPMEFGHYSSEPKACIP